MALEWMVTWQKIKIKSHFLHHSGEIVVTINVPGAIQLTNPLK